MSLTIYGNTVGTPISPGKIEEVLKPVKTVNRQFPDENGNVEIKTPVKGIDYFDPTDKAEIVDAVKATVPLVKTAEHPIPVNSVDECIDTSRAYLLPDGYLWAYKKVGAKTLTADDVVLTNVLPDGALEAGVPRIATKELLPCGNETISISCPSPYQYFIYFYTDNDTSTFIGKTTWVSGDIADVLTATMGSGTSSGAKYCRISLRDGTNSAANLTGRIGEFMSNITIKQGIDSQSAWTNTGHLYVQPAEKPFYTLQGKNIACFGDSLAANCYVGSGKQWIQRVGEFFQCGKIYNRGVGGSAVSSINGSGKERNNYAAFNADGEAYLRISYKTGEAPMEIPEGYVEMRASMELDERVNTIPLDTDILLIEAGTNDNDLDAETLSAAYDRMLVKIQNRIPNAKIVILGLPFVNPKIYSSDDQREYLRNKLDELMGGIREVGKKYGIPVIELKDTAQVNLINYTNYMSTDALHYDTEAGTKRWAETVIKGMFGLMFLS